MMLPLLIRVLRGRFALAALLLAVTSYAWSHHSTAIYDSDNPVELAGAVVEWQFVNPHVVIVLEVENADGGTTVWTVEGSNTAGVFRRGWTPETLQPGDRIIVTVRPLHSGAPGGNYRNVRWQDGTPVDPRAPRPTGE